MKVQMKSWKSIEREMFKDPVFRSEYKKLDQDPEFALLDAMIQANKKGLTQKDIALKMGTTQSAVSRALSGSVSPTIGFLDRFAKAIGLTLKIQFT